ncbi:hypothetical protein AVEN_11847-1 [Araneus ventricosus]|uniref:Uncharacterized protein n=1 Tax=Araneus ventricosus TaxID=182803 RepID=A0A4Y2WDL0_ARAVE|nr:hypothetical protein AVEN_143026-1 [Araneus ventricosus]GBO35545.1 hypothetical protein AVEN_11847-1 [Araneus ventricosus]
MESEAALHMKKYDALAMKNKGAVLSFWAKQSMLKKEDHQASASVAEKIDVKFEEEVKLLDVLDKDIPQKQPAKKAKVQEELKLQLDVINNDLVDYYKRKSSGMLTEKQETKLNENKAKKRKVEAELKKKINEQRRQKKSREEKKKKLAELRETHPHVKEALKIREKCGRPRLEADQPELLKAIVDIAIHGSAAHENRQSDVHRSMKNVG